MTLLSVVVAAKESGASLDEVLAVLAPQVAAFDSELIIVAAAGSPEAERTTGETLLVPGDPLVPDLWRAGILASQGEWVAVTTAQCVPDDRWIASLLASIDDGVAAIGGPFALGSRRPAEAAVFLLRYSPYLLPFERHDVDDVPGDNAVYRRSVIDAVSASWNHGFWENEVNAALRKRGDRLVLDPRPLVHHRTSGGVRAFCRQRFRHGRVYGAWRSAGRRQLLQALAAPIVPLLMLARIWQRVGRRPGGVALFIRSLPWLMLYLVCWAAGEALGRVKSEE